MNWFTYIKEAFMILVETTGWLLATGIGLFLLYVIARVFTAGIAKSWYEQKNKQGDNNNEK